MTKQDILYRLACAISDLASASRIIASRIAGLDDSDLETLEDAGQMADVETLEDVESDFVLCVPLSKKHLSLINSVVKKSSNCDFSLLIDDKGHGALIAFNGTTYAISQDNFDCSNLSKFLSLNIPKSCWQSKFDSVLVCREGKYIITDSVLETTIEATENKTCGLNDKQALLRTPGASSFVRSFEYKGQITIKACNVKTFLDCLFISDDTTRIEFTGFFVDKKGEIVTTDGKCLSVLKQSNDTFSIKDFDTNIIIDPIFIKKLNTFKADITISRLTNLIDSCSFSCGNITIISKNIDGTFPNFSKVIPSHFNSSLIFNPKSMSATINRFPKMPRGNTDIIIFDCKDRYCRITSPLPNKVHWIDIDKSIAEFDAKTERFGLNRKLFLDAIAAASYFCSDSLKLNIVDPDSPLTILTDNLDCVIMPMEV